MEKIIYGIQQIGVGVSDILFRINNKFLIISLIFGLLSVDRVSATEQMSDRLIIDGELFALVAYYGPYPLESYQVKFSPKMLFGESATCVASTCWRGYVATWSIENDSLFLQEIKNYCYDWSEDDVGTEYADLSQLFSGKYRNGRVFAEWVIQDLFSPRGKEYFYLSKPHLSKPPSLSYEEEVYYVIKNGILQEIKHYNHSPYFRLEEDEFINEVYNRIDWSQILDLGDKKIQVTASFSANTNGIVDSVKIINGDELDVLYQQVVLNAIRGIGGFGVCLVKGRPIRDRYSFSVLLSSENRDKYIIKQKP